MKRFKHINCKSLEEAVAVLKAHYGNAKVVAGGTDLIGQLKDNILTNYPNVIVNIKSVPGLDFIRESGQNVVIGALTRLEDIANSPIVKEKLAILALAAGGTASPHIRDMGTLAGNISQTNRCWYYWVPENRFNCMRKGGHHCYALTGDGRYHSIFGGVRVNMTPCSQSCPNNVEIPDYMSKIREGDLAAAVKVLMRSNPLPAVTGRVCPHFCESECHRRDTDEAVSIRGVERHLGDYALEYYSAIYAPPQQQLKLKVAVLGSGPSGLSAAYFLRKMGYTVTVFEKMEKAGGLLSYGIPPYRLPRDVVNRQIDALSNMGIEFRLNSGVGTEISLQGLLTDYAAVYAACGAWKERAPGIKGAEYMLSGAQFLRQANSGAIASPGKKVAVIGGGNVAVDVARTLLRLGSEPVIIYRRGKAEMPALKDEVLKAEEEGIQIQFLTLQVEVQKKSDKLALTCQRMELGPIDESGRRRPIVIPGSDFIAEYDAVMTAIGEEPDISIIPDEYLTENGSLAAEENTGRISQNFFAGGDFVTGPSTVIAAIAAGRKGAAAINRYLTGKEDPPGAANNWNFTDDVSQNFNSRFLVPTKRSQTPELSIEARLAGVNLEESGGLEPDAVTHESNRCLNCSCVSVNPSDTAPVLIVLNARIITTKRIIEAQKYFATGIDQSTILEPDEIVKEISIPLPVKEARSGFTKFALRKSIDFPVVNCAAVIEQDEGIVKAARICLNSVYNQPVRVTAAESFITGKIVDEETAEQASQLGLKHAFSLVNNQYKIKIARTLVKRVIMACVQK